MAESDRNCLSYWFPKLKASGAPVPETHIVPAPPGLEDVLESGVPPGWPDFIAELTHACLDVGLPAFLRTGRGSGKHEWKNTCYIASAGDLPRHVYRLVEWSALVDFLGLPTDVWAVRGFLPLETAFLAFADFPVNKERRYFIKDGKAICRHSYWPEAAVAKGVEYRDDAPPNWRELLARINHESEEEVALLTSRSWHVARHFDGAWSLDWACDVDGNWWAIDMAEASRSFHWPDCPHAQEVT